MYQLREIGSADEELKRFCSLRGYSSLTPESYLSHHVDSSWIAEENGVIVARYSLWWTQVPPYANHKVGVIGHYAALNKEAARLILEKASAELFKQNCTIAIGPMDGNTWRSYRLVTERGTEPPFFLEINHPDDWPEHFTDSGFTPLAHYYSTLNDDLSHTDPRLGLAQQRISQHGITVRSLSTGSLAGELKKIHSMAVKSFQKNFLYTPLEESEFVSQYLPVQKYLREELCLIAENQNGIAGFLFSVPNMLELQRDKTISTIIIKTLAVHPEFMGLGLGSLLATQCQQRAKELGFKRAIHALMHESNISRNVSKKISTRNQQIRRYALFAKVKP